jgi:hypothetical protein
MNLPKLFITNYKLHKSAKNVQDCEGDLDKFAIFGTQKK